VASGFADPALVRSYTLTHIWCIEQHTHWRPRMYYHGIDTETRRAIERAQQERAKAIAAFWASLFAFRARHPKGAATQA